MKFRQLLTKLLLAFTHDKHFDSKTISDSSKDLKKQDGASNEEIVVKLKDNKVPDDIYPLW